MIRPDSSSKVLQNIYSHTLEYRKGIVESGLYLCKNKLTLNKQRNTKNVSKILMPESLQRPLQSIQDCYRVNLSPRMHLALQIQLQNISMPFLAFI